MLRKKYSTLRVIIEILCTILVVILFITSFKIIVVSGESMYPTLQNHQIVIAKKHFSTLEYNDIVVLNIDNQLTIKRVIACGGDEVSLKDNSVFVNEVKIVPYSYEGEVKTIQLQSDEIFVIGDNHTVSYDSRDYGAVSISQVIGVKL